MSWLLSMAVEASALDVVMAVDVALLIEVWIANHHGVSLVFSGASNRSTGVFRRIFLRSSLLTCDSWSINSGIWSVLKVPDTHHFPVGVDFTMARSFLLFRIMLALRRADCE